MNEQSPPKKLTRSRSDRYIGGVAAGIGERFNVDPIFVRIGFVVSLAFGGLGLLAYVALLALTPIEGDPAEPLPPVEPKRRNQMIGLAVVMGIVAIATADSGRFAAWIFGFWPGTVFGVLFWVAAGVGLAWLFSTGAFTRGKAKEAAGSAPPPGSQSAPGSSPTAPADLDDTDPEPSTELVTYAESPTQLSRTEIMETRSMYAAPAPGDESGEGDSVGQSPAASDEAETGIRDRGPSTIGRIMVWLAIGITGLIVFCCLFVFSAGTTAMFGGVPMAALVIVLGAGMVFAGLRGRRQLSLWLLTAAVAVTLPMAAVSIADLRVEGSYGDINETPLSMTDIPSDGYEMAAGNMTIDLRKLDFPRDGEIDLEVRSGMGLTSVIVPDRVCVTGEVRGKAGVATFRGRESNGIDITKSVAPVTPTRSARLANPQVRLDGEFKLGAFEIVDNTQWRRLGRGGSFDSKLSIEELARERATAACSEMTSPSKKARS